MSDKKFSVEKISKHCKIEVFYDYFIPIYLPFLHIPFKTTLDVTYIKEDIVNFKITNVGRLTQYYYSYRVKYPDETFGQYYDIQTFYPILRLPDPYIKVIKGDSITFTMECKNGKQTRIS